jgi:hypothetical protein
MTTTGEALTSRARQAAAHPTHGTAFKALARFGFVARGILYGLIGVLALDVAFGQGGANASQAGAMQTVAHQPFGEWLLIGVTIGLAGYAAWRLVEAATGRGIDDSAGDRVVALVSGIVYLSFTVLAIRVLTSPSHNAGQKPKAGSAASDALSLPGGQIVLGIAGAVLVGVGLFQLYKGLSQKFVEDANTGQMSETTRHAYTLLGVTGYIARAAVFGLVGGLMLKAAYDNAGHEAKGLDGALQRLVHASYGPYLLAAIAAGLIAFGLYSLADARFRRI